MSGVPAKKLLVVFGATGHQGRSVIDSVMNDKTLCEEFKIRGLVHDTWSRKAKKLTERGIEVKKVDLNNWTSICEAVQGAYAVYALTIAQYAGAKINELEQGKYIVDACKQANVEQFIYAALPNAKKISGGKWEVAHFTQKSEVEEYAKKAGFRYTGFPCPPFYYENFINFFPPVQQGGEWVFSFPDTKHLTAATISDIGPVVCCILHHPGEMNGIFVPIVGEQGTPEYFVKEFAAGLGVKARVNLFPIESLKKDSKEFYEMFGYFNDCDYYGPHLDKTIQTRALPHPLKFRDWVKQEGLNAFAHKKDALVDPDHRRGESSHTH